MMSTTIIFLWLAALSDPQASAAQEALDTVSDSSRQLVSAKQIKRNAPIYPRRELRKGKQAWVHITYCIDESGSTQNVSVLSSVGGPRFDRAAVEAIKRWKFEPALIDGERSWQSRNETYITFSIEGGNTGASRKFVNLYRKIDRLIDQKNLQKADKLFRHLFETDDLSLYELSKLWALRVRYEGAGGDTDMYKLDRALHRATASKGEWIDKASYVRLLKLRVQIEMVLGKYHAANQSFRELVKATGEDAEEVLALKPMMEKLRDRIDSDNILKINAEVRTRDECNNCKNSWYFTPVRNDFALANISGNLESIEMRCDHKRFESAVSDLVEWHIPVEWGTCYIQIYGDLGTTFDVLLLPTT